MSKSINVPKLRFKEFSGDWKEKKFADIYDFFQTNSFSRALLNYESGDVKNIHYGDIHTKFKSNFFIYKEKVPFISADVDTSKLKDENYCQIKDLVIADASEDYNDIGKTIEIIELNDEKLVAGLHTYIARDTKNKMALGFGGYFMQTYSVRLQMMKLATGISVLGISKSNLSNMSLVIPSKQEQEKIASFLISIDTKIEQIRKKEELLHQYKKGVIQKIFNKYIRFKSDDGSEFCEWEEKKLGDLGTVITGKTPSTSNSEFWNGKIEFITPTDIEGSKYQTKTTRTVTQQSNMKILPIGTIVYTCIASIGKMSLSTLPSITNQQINSLIVNDKKYNNEFVYYALLKITPYIQSTQANTTLPIINKTEFSKFIINVPCIEEQTKIANFLSSIDSKIEQVQKQLNFIKEFKKSLLHQMFV